MERRTSSLSTPSWLLGPGLVVPPLFVPLLLCMLPWPAPVSLPIPELDGPEASRHLGDLARRAQSFAPDRQDRELLSLWSELQAQLYRSGGGQPDDERRLAELQLEVRHRGASLIRSGRRERLIGLGDLVALSLLRSLSAPRGDDALAGARLEPARLGFLRSARRSGLVDDRGDLRAHPAVALSLLRMGWRSDCGLPQTEAMEPIALDGVDVYRLRFGWALPLEARLRSLQRFSTRHPDYPADQASAALLLAAGERERALVLLYRIASRQPGSLAARNHILFAQQGQR